jgi:hypothetical protein
MLRDASNNNVVYFYTEPIKEFRLSQSLLRGAFLTLYLYFTQSEKFTGSMIATLEGWLDTVVKQNFEDMNRALKQRAEEQ